MSQLHGTLIDEELPQRAPCASDSLFRLIVVGQGKKRRVLLHHGSYEMISVEVEAFLAFLANGQQIYQEAREARPHSIVPEDGAFGFIRFFGPEGNLKVLMAERTLSPGRFENVSACIGSSDILVLDHGEFWMLLTRGHQLFEEAEHCSPHPVVIPQTHEV